MCRRHNFLTKPERKLNGKCSSFVFYSIFTHEKKLVQTFMRGHLSNIILTLTVAFLASPPISEKPVLLQQLCDAAYCLADDLSSQLEELTEVREEFEATQVFKRFLTMAADSFSCNFRLLKDHRFIPDQIPASKIRDFCMQANAP
jgi:hypothetical protein